MRQRKDNIKAQGEVKNRFDHLRELQAFTALIFPGLYESETVGVRVHTAVK
jgi:hypothetical protein